MLWHWSSMNATPESTAEGARLDDLVHDPEELERVGGPDHQVVVGVEPGVEVEPAEAIRPEQGRHDELDVGARRVMAGVDDDLRLRPGGDALDVGGPPVGDVHRVERRLEELVLEQHPLVRPEPRVDRGERLGQPVLAGADVVLTGIVRPVGEPQLQVARTGRIHDVDAGEEMIERLAAHARVRVADAPEHVVVVLEHVGVDGAEADPDIRGVAGEVGVVVDLVPRDVERDGRRDPGEPVDLRGVGDLLVRVRGTPFWAKTLNRVPELPKAQEGSSIRWARSAATTAWLLITSASVAHRAGFTGRILVRLDRTRRALVARSLPQVSMGCNSLS